MSGTEKTPAATVAAYYDRAAADLPAFTVLNYGYADSATESRVPSTHPERFCLALYEHTVRNTPLERARVLEVSCGRGGGASFLKCAFGIGAIVGIDLSKENIRIARERNDGPEFALGDAQHLNFADESFDVVINIEASHLYEDRRTFFAEVFRVLKPAGHFCYTDIYRQDDNCLPDLLNAGFELLERREITTNVIAALELDNARRTALFDAMPQTDRIEEYKNLGGVVGYRAWNRFLRRETRYFSHRLRKPD